MPIYLEYIERGSALFCNIHRLGVQVDYSLSNQIKVQCFKVLQVVSHTCEKITWPKLKTIWFDRGGEFTASHCRQFLKQNGIAQRTSCAYTPGRSEIAWRMNRRILAMARPMFVKHNVPKEVSADSVVTAVYTKNRVACRGFSADMAPFEVWHNIKPEVSHLGNFGSECYYQT